MIFKEFCVPQVFLSPVARKKDPKNVWYRMLGTEILSYEEFHRKTTQMSEENESYPAK